MSVMAGVFRQDLAEQVRLYPGIVGDRIGAARLGKLAVSCGIELDGRSPGLGNPCQEIISRRCACGEILLRKAGPAVLGVPSDELPRSVGEEIEPRLHSRHCEY